MKRFTGLVFFSCFLTASCVAQAIDDDERIAPKASKANGIAVTFNASDSCNLRINGKDYGDIVKNKSKTIMLALGSYKMSFESLETGEVIINRSFRLLRDSVKSGRYAYPVAFKQ